MDNRALYTVHPEDPLENAVLAALRVHIGKDYALPKPALVDSVRKHGFAGVEERTVRAAIQRLRKRGALICSAGGAGGGYWLARDWEELQDFLDREIRARALDLLEQDKAMKSAAAGLWGPASLQFRLKI